jgi:hypothetical protein
MATRTAALEDLSLTSLLGFITPSVVASFVATVFVVGIAVYLPSRTGVLYNTPDETANHIFTEKFAETGKLWYTTEYSSFDEENLLHPRGVLTRDGRQVSYQYPTLPLVYGTLYRVVGENVKYIGAVFALATLFFVSRTAKLLYGAPFWQVAALFLGFTPLLFQFSRPYMAAGPALAFFAGGCWLLTRYVLESKRQDLALATAMFAAGMLFRYEFIFFSSLLVVCALWYKHQGNLRLKVLWLDLSLYLAMVAALFLLPVLLANTIVYGSPLTYGYKLFNAAYLPDRGAQEGASFFENMARRAQEVLLPQGTFDVQLFLRNITRFTFGLMPALSTLALLGAVVAFRRGAVQWRYLVPFGLAVFYMLIYMAGGDTWNATTKFATFDASFVRYWLPLGILMVILAGYALRLFHDPAVQWTLAVVIAVYGIASVVTLTHGSLSDVDKAIANYETWAQEVIVPNTEEDAVIFTGLVDKGIVPYRDVAAWWGGTYDRDDAARSMARVYYSGHPVYVYKERTFSILDLNVGLARYDLHAIETDGPALYKVVRFDHSRDE